MKRTIGILAGLLLITVPGVSADIGLNTVVIDAGHGGTDPGAVSLDRKTYEKTLTLDISRKLAEKIKSGFPEVNVVQSRPEDKFVALEDRASCANGKNADLFISIHINSTKSSSPNGYSVHVLGQSSNKNKDLFAYNMDVCKRENSVILLEDDYNTKYQGFDPSDPESFIFMQLLQNSHLEQSLEFAQLVSEKLVSGPIRANRGIWQNPFLVLWRTSMPSVLVELGFISNASDLASLRDNQQRDRIADCLFQAFREYKKRYDASVNIARAEKPAKEVKPEPLPSENRTEELFGWQIMAGKSKLPSNDRRFLGFEPTVIEAGNGILKYVIGVSDSAEKAYANKVEIRKKYPDAFFVRISNGVFPFSYKPEKRK